MIKEFQALNIKCGGCANSVKKALKMMFGEVDVNLDVHPRVVSVNIKDEEHETLFRKTMRSLGYPIADEESGKLEEMGMKAKSFVSCAIGKTELKIKGEA